MNKTELVAALAAKAEISKKDAEKALAAVLGSIEDALKAGDPIATLYASKAELLDAAAEKLLASTAIGSEKLAPRPLILGVVE